MQNADRGSLRNAKLLFKRQADVEGIGFLNRTFRIYIKNYTFIVLKFQKA